MAWFVWQERKASDCDILRTQQSFFCQVPVLAQYSARGNIPNRPGSDYQAVIVKMFFLPRPRRLSPVCKQIQISDGDD
jgi:hypothetical protein